MQQFTDTIQSHTETLDLLPCAPDTASYQQQFEFRPDMGVIQNDQPDIFNPNFQQAQPEQFAGPGGNLDDLLQGALSAQAPDVSCLMGDLNVAQYNGQKQMGTNLKQQTQYKRLNRIPGPEMAFNVEHEATKQKYVMRCYNVATTAPQRIEELQQESLKKNARIELFMEDGWMYTLEK